MQAEYLGENGEQLFESGKFIREIVVVKTSSSHSQTVGSITPGYHRVSSSSVFFSTPQLVVVEAACKLA